MAWTLFSLKQLREGPVASITLVLFTLVTCAVFAATPRLLESEADQTLRSALAANPVDVRGLQVIEEGRIARLDDPLGLVRLTGQRLESMFPAAVEACVGRRSFVVDTPRFVMPSSIVDGATLRLRFDPYAAAGFRVVAGRLPSAAVHPRGDGVPSFEVALSRESAHVLRVSPGSRFTVSLDASDILAMRQTGSIEVVVVGLYEVVDPSAEGWFNDPSLAHPNSRSIAPPVSIDDATAYASPDAYAAFIGAPFSVPLRYTWRFSIASERVSATAAPAIEDGLERMESLFPASAISSVSGSGALRTGLLQLLRNETTAWNSVAAVLSVFTVGAGSVAALALMLVAVVAGRSRRRFVAVLRNRGASRSHVIVSTVADGTVLALPAAVVGAALAGAVVPAGDLASSSSLAAVTALVTVVVYAASARAGSSDGSSAGAAGVRRAAVPDASRRRAVLEILAVAIAALAVFELRSRGIASLGGEGSAPDPWIAAAPALVAFAASLAAIRLFPIVLRLLAAAASRGRGLVVVLALRLASRSGAGGPVLASLVTIAAIGAFASATLVHLDRTAEAAAWQSTGAPFRVGEANGVALPRALLTADLPGVEASATVTRVQWRVRVTVTGISITLVALDPQAYAAVVRGTPADGVVPVGALTAGASPATAIVSEGLTTGPAHLAVGQTLDLSLDPGSVSWRIVATAPSFPGVPDNTEFVVVSRETAVAALSAGIPVATDLLLRAPASYAGPLGEAVANLDPTARLVDAEAEARVLKRSPYRDAVFLGAAAAALLAAGYAALAIAAAFALAGAGRALELAQLRTLGLTGREALALAVIEHVPTVSLGFLGGAAIGLWLFAFLEPGLGLAAVIGRQVSVPAGLEPWQLGLLLVWLVVLVAVGIAIETSLERRTVLVIALRRGVE
jgi:putative ABC transport system permease protein